MRTSTLPSVSVRTRAESTGAGCSLCASGELCNRWEPRVHGCGERGRLCVSPPRQTPLCVEDAKADAERHGLPMLAQDVRARRSGENNRLVHGGCGESKVRKLTSTRAYPYHPHRRGSPTGTPPPRR